MFFYYFSTSIPQLITTHLIKYYDDDVIKWKLYRITGPLCAGTSSATGGFPSQRASYADFEILLCELLNAENKTVSHFHYIHCCVITPLSGVTYILMQIIIFAQQLILTDIVINKINDEIMNRQRAYVRCTTTNLISTA